MKTPYRKDDVWLCECLRGSVKLLRPITILELNGDYLRYDHGWTKVAEFHASAKVRLGRQRRFLGIPCGIERDFQTAKE